MARRVEEVIWTEDKSDQIFNGGDMAAKELNSGAPDGEESMVVTELHPDYSSSELKRRIISDTLRGTLGMREWAHRTYINRLNYYSTLSSYSYNSIDYFPQKDKETQEEYFRRVNKCLMSQYVGKTIDTYVGMVFRKPAFVTGEPIDKIKKLEKNINFEGDNLNTFAQRCLRTAIEDGISFLYVQTSRPTYVTAKDFQTQVRTWFTIVRADDLLDWDHETGEDGTLRLKYIVINLNPFSRSPRRLRVNSDGTYFLYEQDEKAGFKLIDQGLHGYKEIPFYPIYSKKKEDAPKFIAEPPLMEMAWAQIADMNKRSDLDHGEEHSCYTSMYITSKIPADEMGLSGGMGPNRILIIPDFEAKVGQIQTNSSGLSEARRGVEDNKRRIFDEGLSFVTDKKAYTRTTAKEIDNDRELQVSPLMATVASLQNAFDKALDMFCHFEGIETDETVKFKFNNDLNMLSIDANTAALLSKMAVLGQLSFETLLETLKRGEVLPHDIDPINERKRINGQSSEDIRDKSLEVEAPQTSEPTSQGQENGEPTLYDQPE